MQGSAFSLQSALNLAAQTKGYKVKASLQNHCAHITMYNQEIHVKKISVLQTLYK